MPAKKKKSGAGPTVQPAEAAVLEAAALCGGPDAQVDSRLCQPQGAVRSALEEPLSDRGGRPSEASAIGARRPDRSDSDPGQETSTTGPKDHWSLVQIGR